MNLPIPDWRNASDTVWLYRGDCAEIMPEIEAGLIDTVVTDPPYRTLREETHNGRSTIAKPVMGKLAEKKWELPPAAWVSQAARLMKVGATFYSFCGFDDVGVLKMQMRAAGLRVLNNLIWIKTNPIPSYTKHVYRNSAEVAVYGSKESINYFRERLQQELLGVYYYPVVAGDERTAHPTQKPLEIFREWILDSCPPGGWVIDPFMGSGTSGKVAAETGRRYIGIEKDAFYFTLARDRIERSLLQLPLFAWDSE